MVPGPDEPRSFQPALTPREVRHLGYTRREYREAARLTLVTVEHHHRLGTPRSLWEPPEHVTAVVVRPGLEAAAAAVEDRLRRCLDLALDELRGCAEAAAGAVGRLARTTRVLRPGGSGASYAPSTAVRRVRRLDAVIDADERLGRFHHRRTSRWWRRLAPFGQVVETAGFLWFCDMWLDVPFLRPQDDIGGWTLAVAVVAATVWLQNRFVHLAADAHNAARQAFAENHRHAAEQLRRRRTLTLAASASTVTAALASGMALRGFVTLSDAGRPTLVYMLALAVLAGYAMPTIAYLARALDGSSLSRERDELVEELDERLAEHEDAVDFANENLARARTIGARLRSKDFHDVVAAAQAELDDVHRPYGLVRLLVGHLATPTPGTVPPTVTVDGEGRPVVALATSLPGAGATDLGQVVVRVERLATLERFCDDVAAALAATPEHPWSVPRTDA